MIKAVFFDIDGTLVSFKTHRVPESTVKAIAALRDRGVRVFVASGRHLLSINNLGDLQFDGYITLNGGYCMVGERVVYKHSIPPEDISSVVRYMEEPPCVSLREAAKGEIFQLVAFFTREQEGAIMSVMPCSEATRWNPLFTDVIPRGSSKQVGVDKIIEYFGIPLEETMAFGDGGNDIPMLRHVGIGVAMGNAENDVKQVADYVTASVDEDGIEKALRHFGVI